MGLPLQEECTHYKHRICRAHICRFWNPSKEIAWGTSYVRLWLLVMHGLTGSCLTLGIQRMLYSWNWMKHCGSRSGKDEVGNPITCVICFTDRNSPCLGEVYESIYSMYQQIKRAVYRRYLTYYFILQIQVKIYCRCDFISTPLHMAAYAGNPNAMTDISKKRKSFNNVKGA